MIVYFVTKNLNILGQASTSLPKGLKIVSDKRIEEVETGISSFEGEISFDYDTRKQVEEWAAVGNYILINENDDCGLYTIVETEISTKNQTLYCYAEDVGLDLLNEVVGEEENAFAASMGTYVKKLIDGTGFELGTNESTGLIALKFESEQTKAARLADIAAAFKCEISFTFEVKRLRIERRYINIHKPRGKDAGTTLYLNKHIDNISINCSIANLATALKCTGGTPEDSDDPITLKGYRYDDGDIYVDGDIIKSRKAFQKWARLLWKTSTDAEPSGHITKLYDSRTEVQSELFKEAYDELKKYSDAEVNYEIDINTMPDNVRIGDRINIVDEKGELYLSSRILKLERSICEDSYTATLGDHIIKPSGIHQKVLALAEKFQTTAVSAARAKKIADNANEAAEEAQYQARFATAQVTVAQTTADEAKTAANTAIQSAADAQTAADAAQAAVNGIQGDIESMNQDIADANEAAEYAKEAAETAKAKAEESLTASETAKTDAAAAQTAASEAKTASESAEATSNEAKTTAETAISQAEEASTIANAAKLDAEAAEADVKTISARLDTISTTMQADYVRKTELTETEASLQSQITQNAAQISQNVQNITKIDETANSAAESAEKAQETAEAAQADADDAATAAAQAQTAADNAAQAAADAQAEADTAAAAAATAQEVADKAETDLATAQENLAAISSRVDATEEDIAAAEQLVADAQAAADKAKADAATATDKAESAQSKADKAATTASNAQTIANDAVNKATIAQAAADAAKGDASAAQATADEAKTAALNAKTTADAAAADAAQAQTTADNAVADAAAATQAAANAQAEVDQAEADLAAAKEELATIESKADATAEEVETAKANVAIAQAAADEAKTNAANAQATADAAKANAEQAQKDADTAQQAADDAQAAADAAQAAADAAQAEVDALEVRVVAAETSITQTSERIELLATKQEVATTLGGYYTKEDIEARLTATSQSINLSVDSKIENIKVGGRNLFAGYSEEEIQLDDYQNVGSFKQFSGNLTFDPCETVGDAYTISFWAKSPNGSTPLSIYNQNGRPRHFYFPRTTMTSALGSEWEYFTYTFVNTDGGEDYADTSCNRIEFYASAQMGVLVKKIKVEKGTLATDWTPAPEDVDSEIDDATSKADNALEGLTEAQAQLQLLTDSIAQLVRNGETGTLIKQTADGLYYFDISELESTIDAANTAIANLEGVVLDVNGQIDLLKTAAEALQSRTEYVKSYTDENDQPCLELGEGDSAYKLFITNTGILMKDGTETPTQVTNKQLVITKATVREELQIGDDEDASVSGVWLLKRRANGNLGLIWKDVTE